MNVIPVWNIDDPAMNAERQRLSSWAPMNNWAYFSYGDPNDLLTQLPGILSGQPLEILDIDGHGTPNSLDGLDGGNLAQFGQNLSQITGFNANTLIVLDGCNTGLDDPAPCIAQQLATIAGCQVKASEGYLSGTYAEDNETCTIDATVGGIYFPPYPGAINASGRAVWRTFGASQRMNLRLGSANVRLTPKLAQVATASVVLAVKGVPHEEPSIRVGADASLDVRFPDGRDHHIDILARGRVIADRTAHRTYQVDEDMAGVLWGVVEEARSIGARQDLPRSG